MKLKGLPSLVAGLVTSGLVGLVLAASQEPVAVQAVPLPQSTHTEVDRSEGSTRSAQRDDVNASAAPTPSQSSVAAAAAAQPTVTVSAGEESGKLLAQPVSGAMLTSPFGPRLHPILGIWKPHTGQDWAAGCGTPVGASADGTVVYAGWAGGYGLQIKISHGELGGYGEVVTTYNHLSSIAVSVGQSVKALQGIGQMGTTGSSTGCHLHFEVIADGNFTDPMQWINGEPVTIDFSGANMTVPQNSSAPSTSASSRPSTTPSASRSTSSTPSQRPSNSSSAPATTPSSSTPPSTKPSASQSSNPPSSSPSTSTSAPATTPSESAPPSEAPQPSQTPTG